MVKPFRHLPWLSMLDRKLVRDLWTLRTQAIAIALVIASGVAVHLVAAGMLDSLQETRRAYYERYRFADVWAPVVRAPEAVASELRNIDGVVAVETRLRSQALLDMPTMAAPASADVLSLPEGRAASVNGIHLAEGRLPRSGHRDEVVINEGFALAHRLAIGDTITATLYARQVELVIVGIALSPEYVYAFPPGQIVPDARLFGVIWMGREALGHATGQDGAFNEAALRLMQDQNPAEIIHQVDRILAPYGAPGAYARDDQVSDVFVSGEIVQLETMGGLLPPIFLGVAAFLVNVVLARLVATERAEIGLMKAFGYRNRDVIAAITAASLR